MLSLRDWTPYELTQQMQRSLAYCWPTSERALYTEPERLVAAGLAEVTITGTATRPRRTYAITPAGRAALQQWLRTPPGAMRISNEPLLRLLFADQGDPGDLLAALEALRESVRAQHRAGAEQITGYLHGGGPFPHRAHLVALFADLYARIFTVVEEWSAEAVDEVSTWSTTRAIGLTDDVRDRMARAVATAPPPADTTSGAL
jgi:DNA-binding PadR family transcriptional regulator